MTSIGVETPRVDGAAKVTGNAPYAADSDHPGTVHGVVVQSGVARARIAAIATDRASAQPGVLGIWTHANRPRLGKATAFPMGAAWQRRPPLHDDRVRYAGQAIAFVVAETFEAARAAAALIAPDYADIVAPRSCLDAGEPERIAGLGLMAKLTSEDSHRGDVEAAMRGAALIVDHVYETPRHLHMAMEPSATVARWEDGLLIVREGTQWVDGAQEVFARWFRIGRTKVRIESAFVGGGFGLRVGLLPEAALPALAARALGRPVKMVMSREKMCRASSGRPAIRQRVVLAVTRNGALLAMRHDTINETDREGVFNEPGSRASRSAYAVATYRAEHSVVRLDIAPPAWMRAPGETPGSFALECAIDELAEAAGIDPLDLRLRNFAEVEPSTGKPWSTNRLREAYAAGAAAFGWAARAPAPRARREGHELIGMGMALANYSGKTAPSEARLRLERDGRVVLESRGVDIGTGAYTALALVVAGALGIPLAQVEVRLGDTAYARSSFAGGSMMTASLGAAVHGAAHALSRKLIALAGKAPAFRGSPRRGVTVFAGRVGAVDGGGARMSFTQLLEAAGIDEVVAEHRTHPTLPSRMLGAKAYTSLAAIAGPTTGSAVVHSFGVHFVEVAVDEDTDTVRVRRMVGALDCGRVINPLTARSQLIGGMTMGLGMALSEGVAVDQHYARPMNANLGEYLVPINADVPPIEILFVGAFDEAGGQLGGKAVGELGITGVAAAIANAVYHATGRRVRSLPIDLRLS